MERCKVQGRIMRKQNRRALLQSAMIAPMLGVMSDGVAADEQPRVIGPRAELKDAVRTQVLVVGAGSSGIPAAISAARMGAKVLLKQPSTK
jgi:hypothetical protein